MRGALEGRGIRPRIVYLEARDDVLIRRFSETRHRHPLGDDRGIARSISRGAAHPRPAAQRGRHRPRHLGPVAARAARAAVRPAGHRGPLGPDGRPAHQLRLQVRAAARVRPRVRRPVHGEPVLPRRAAAAVRADRRGPGVRPRAAGRRSSSSTSCTASSTSRSRPTSPRARRGSRSRSAAPAATTARSSWPRSWPPGCATATAVRSRSSTGSSNGDEPASLAHPGHRHQALAAASPSSVSCSSRSASRASLRQVTRDLESGGHRAASWTCSRSSSCRIRWRALIVGGIGLALVVVGSIRLIRAFMAPFRSTDADQPLVEVIYQKRFLARGPRIVAIGGGTGLSTLLRGLKEHTSNLTAVVTVADDGGSSGVLRHELGIPAVGDIRNCIAALADAEPLMSELLQYRFPATGPGRVDADPAPVDRPWRPRGGQPPDRGDDRGRGRRLRGRHPPGEPDPGRARSGASRHRRRR